MITHCELWSIINQPSAPVVYLKYLYIVDKKVFFFNDSPDLENLPM